MFILISREIMVHIPYGVKNILTLQANINKKRLRGVPIYSQSFNNIRRIDVQSVAIEDNQSGLYLAKCINPLITTTDGKANVRKILHANSYTLCIADGIGFGSEIGRVLEILARNQTNQLYLWESFEQQALTSPWLHDITTPPVDCDNVEEFYTKRLTKILSEQGGALCKG